MDVGFGTGILAKKLYDCGCEIYGIDFSQRMVDIAREKMPGAMLVQHDFSRGLPDSIKNRRFDYIVSTYAIHHLDGREKTGLIREMLQCLSGQGLILIGDVAFERNRVWNRQTSMNNAFTRSIKRHMNPCPVFVVAAKN